MDESHVGEPYPRVDLSLLEGAPRTPVGEPEACSSYTFPCTTFVVLKSRYETPTRLSTSGIPFVINRLQSPPIGKVSATFMPYVSVLSPGGVFMLTALGILFAVVVVVFDVTYVVTEVDRRYF